MKYLEVNLEALALLTENRGESLALQRGEDVNVGPLARPEALCTSLFSPTYSLRASDWSEAIASWGQGLCPEPAERQRLEPYLRAQPCGGDLAAPNAEIAGHSRVLVAAVENFLGATRPRRWKQSTASCPRLVRSKGPNRSLAVRRQSACSAGSPHSCGMTRKMRQWTGRGPGIVTRARRRRGRRAVVERCTRR